MRCSPQVSSVILSVMSVRDTISADKTTLIAALAPLVAQHSSISILVKGSRSSAMEEVVHALQENVPC